MKHIIITGLLLWANLAFSVDVTSFNAQQTGNKQIVATWQISNKDKSKNCSDRIIKKFNNWHQKYRNNYAGKNSLKTLYKISNSKCQFVYQQYQQWQMVAKLRGNNRSQAISQYAQNAVKNWINQQNAPKFTANSPKKSRYNSLPKLIKDEFENIPQFKARITTAKQQYIEHVKQVDDDYEDDVAQYNNAVEAYNFATKQHQQYLADNSSRVRKTAIGKALLLAYGAQANQRFL